MNDAELTKLYKKIEIELDNLGFDNIREYAHPEFNNAELMAIPKIIEHLKNNKYKEAINVALFPMRTKVTKVQTKEAEKSVFDPENLTFEKSEAQIQAEQAYNNCISNNHRLVKSNRTTFGNPILTCAQCKLGYTYKLQSGAAEVKTVYSI